jgi:20S proteasome subunit beta 5
MRPTNYMLEDAEWDCPSGLYNNPQFMTPLFKSQIAFSLPHTSKPFQNHFEVNLQKEKHQNKDIKKLMDFSKGTTTLGFKFKEGVLLAVDSRASMGDFNASEEVLKFIPITKKMIGTMAGGAADCLFWEENLGRMVNLYELEHGEELTSAAASKMFSNMMYRYRGKGLSIGSIIGGTDSTGTHLFYCDNEGNRVEGNLFTCGSGGTFAYGILDSHLKWDMTVEEAVQLGKRAIYEATYCDAGSGGSCNVVYIDHKGWKYMEMWQDNNSSIWKRINANSK